MVESRSRSLALSAAISLSLALNAVRSAAMDLFDVGPVIPETTQA